MHLHNVPNFECYSDSNSHSGTRRLACGDAVQRAVVLLLLLVEQLVPANTCRPPFKPNSCFCVQTIRCHGDIWLRQRVQVELLTCWPSIWMCRTSHTTSHIGREP